MGDIAQARRRRVTVGRKRPYEIQASNRAEAARKGGLAFSGRCRRADTNRTTGARPDVQLSRGWRDGIPHPGTGARAVMLEGGECVPTLGRGSANGSPAARSTACRDRREVRAFQACSLRWPHGCDAHDRARRPRFRGRARGRSRSGSQRAVARPARDHVPDRRRLGARRDAHRRRRQHVHRLRRRRRLPQRRARPSRRASPPRTSSSTGSPTPTSRSSPTSRTSRSPSGLAERVPISGPVKAAFFNAGTEAVENAVKFARAYTGRPAVIAFEGAFHGRTLLSLSLTSKVHPVQGRASARSRPRSTACRSRTPTAASRPRTRSPRSSARSRPRSPPRRVAAIVLEPVQGEGGFIVAPPEFVRGRPRDLRPPRDRPRRRRGADRVRPHRPVLRDRALRASSPT